MDKVWDQMKSGAWYDAEGVSLRQLRASCKAKLQQFIKIFCYIGAALLLMVAAGFLLHLLFPDVGWLWRRM